MDLLRTSSIHSKENRVRNDLEKDLRKLVLESHPIEVQISTNKTCNLNCTFCIRQAEFYRASLKDKKPDELIMPWKILEKVWAIFKTAEVVNISTDGEPLSHPDIKKILKLFAHHGNSNLIFVTNGILFDDELIELVVGTIVREIHFSIDALQSKVLNFIRPGVDLDRIVANIEKINHEKRRDGSELPILVLRATFTSLNIGELPSLVDFCGKYGFARIIVQFMQIYSKELSAYSLANNIGLAKCNIAEAFEHGRRTGVDVVLDCSIANIENQRPYYFSGGVDSKNAPVDDTRVENLVEKCSSPWRSVYVQTNGDVYPCCHGGYLMGNLEKAEFKDIWNGDRAVELRKKFRENTLPKECVNRACGIR